ncbi:MAG: hypothetical protein CMH79_04680 [Nitrospinae bacterium]|nr:hypothetical protein [Nitrospinota bacterium]
MEDIEDLINNEKRVQFTKDFVNNTFSSENEYISKFTLLRKKYKLSVSKPQLRKIYFKLLHNNEVEPNNQFLKYSIKKKGKSQSGVSVITILTSPYPKYTNSKGEIVTQTFSCGKNCSYCPNEPTQNFKLVITNINSKYNTLHVKTTDDIHQLRTLTTVEKHNNIYNVIECADFTESTFTIYLTNVESFSINDTVIGTKISQPRSYLSTEPAVLRANRNDFDAVLQVHDRINSLQNCGHLVDKIEILILGGTWDHYPLEYQIEFIRDTYYSVNIFNKCNRDRYPLEEEININQYSNKRIIGLTIETRPDCITLKQIRKLREFNVTRIQIGVQHIDNDILDYINRDSTVEETIQGNQLWKHNGGKVDWHLMPDLPSSSIEKDIDMFRKIFGVHSIKQISNTHFKYELKHPELQADQLKIYPCSTIDWTEIKEWYENGTYKPYSEDEDSLIEVIAFIKNNIFPWIRLNRIIRDIPTLNIIGGNRNINLRQTLLKREDIHCKCIRCREVKGKKIDLNNLELFIREYNGVNSTEYFLSYESIDQSILYGFLRLRINHTNEDLIYDELHNTSFIRELHIYGLLVEHNNRDGNVQHIGLGKQLLKKAEEITVNNGVNKIAIISGVGVREYYEKRGYQLYKNYMVKEIQNRSMIIDICIYVIIPIITFILCYYL